MRRSRRILILMSIAFAVIDAIYLNSAFAAPQVTPRKNSVRRVINQQKQPAGSDNFSRAKAFFAAGDYQRAILSGNADLKANPNRKATTVLMAQSYYRLGRAGQAAKFFAKLAPEDLSSDAAVEYTLAMFATKRYAKATSVWKQVSADHPYRDVARFYAGVSYMHLNLYSKASQLLRQATKIPGNLKSERRRLISELDNLMANQRPGRNATGQVYSYQPQQRFYQVPLAPPVSPIPQSALGVTPPASQAAAAKSEAPIPPKSGLTFSATPEMSYTSKASKADFNGYLQNQGSSRNPAVSMPMQLNYAGKPRSFGGQPTLKVSVRPSYEDREGDDAESKLIASEDDPSHVSAQVNESSSHSFNASLKSGLDVLYPLSDAVDVGIGYQDNRVYSNVSTKYLKHMSGPSAKMVVEGSLVKGQLDWSLIDTTRSWLDNPKVRTEMTTVGTLSRNGESTTTTLKGTYVQTDETSKNGENSSMGADLSWEKNWEDFSLELAGGYVQKTTYPGTIISDTPAEIDMDAARSQMSAGLSLKWTLPFSLELSGSYGYAQFSDYEKKIDDVIVPSAGSKNMYGFGATVSIGTYVSVEAAYSYTTRSMSVSEAEHEAAVLSKACSMKSDSSLKITTRYPF